MMTSVISHDLDILLAEGRSLISEVEKVVKSLEKQPDSQMSALHRCLSKKMQDFQSALVSAEQSAINGSMEIIKSTNEYAHTSPWQAIAIAGAVGALTTYGVHHLFQRDKR
ncbi:glycine zipper domain-containing protein [Undibacterium sp. RuRC25W]|uniref:glycine zipper domain-containing protein n=1 Tax=Undibacterium sp. RuRC25W TaxID=3413047 RepID=UPI003BF17EEB